MKRCGKSAPRFRQRERHGKPHQEQDQIGMANELFPARHPGRSREASGDGRPRGMVIQPVRVDRTRLIGPLAQFFTKYRCAQVPKHNRIEFVLILFYIETQVTLLHDV